MKVLVYSEETPPPLFKLGESKISLLLTVFIIINSSTCTYVVVIPLIHKIFSTHF